MNPEGLLGSIASLLNDIFPKNRLGKILIIVFLSTSVMVSLLIWNSLTGDFTLRRIEKRVSLLTVLYQLEKEGIAKNVELSPLYKNLVRELEGYDPSIVTPNWLAEITMNPNFLQFMGGFILWGLLAIYFIIDKNTSNSIVVVVLFLGVICGILSTFLPDNDVALSVSIPIIIQIVFLILLSRLGSKKQSLTTKPQNS